MPFHRTDALSFLYQLRSICTKESEIFFFSSLTNTSQWKTLSKAFEASKNAQNTLPPLLTK